MHRTAPPAEGASAIEAGDATATLPRLALVIHGSRVGVDADHVLGDLPVAVMVALVLDDEDEVEAGQNGRLQVDVLLRGQEGKASRPVMHSTSCHCACGLMVSLR